MDTLKKFFKKKNQFKDKLQQWREKLRWFRNRWLTRRNPAIFYLHQCKDLLLEAIFLVIATWIVLLVLLHAAELFWKLYLETMMGRQFCLAFPERAERIRQLFGNDLLSLSGRITSYAFFISLGISAIARITHIHRRLYMSLGIIGKLLGWGLALTAITAYYTHELDEITLDFNLALLITAIPTYCMFMRCFYYTEQLVPEAADVISFGVRVSKKVPGIYRKVMERFL